MSGKNGVVRILLACLLACLILCGCAGNGGAPALPEEPDTAENIPAEEPENGPAPVLADGLVTVADRNGHTDFVLQHAAGRFPDSPSYLYFLKTLRDRYGAEIPSCEPDTGCPYELIIGDKGEGDVYKALRAELDKLEFGIRAVQNEAGGITVAVAYKTYEGGCAAVRYLAEHYLTENGFVLPLDTDVRGETTFNRDVRPVTVAAEKILEVTVPDNDTFYNVQGGLFDGELYYQAFVGTVDGQEDAVIAVFDRDGNLLRETGPLGIAHANALSDMGDGTIMIGECRTDENGSYTWSLLDKETLTILKRGAVPFKMISMDYSPERDIFLCMRGGNEAVLLDGGMNERSKITFLFDSGTYEQNFRQTADTVYAPRYIWTDGVGFSNYLYEYDVDLLLRHAYTFDVGTEKEVQSMSVIDGAVCVFCGDHDTSCLAVYRLDIPAENGPDA